MNLITAVFSIAIAAGTCLALVPILCRYAPVWGLTDKPTGRKQHDGAVPAIGGIAIFLALLITVVLLRPSPLILTLLGLGAMLLVLGVVDDRLALSPMHRLPVQILTTLGLIYFTGLQINSVGDLFGTGPIQLSGAASVVFTVICTVGVINAINMIDGVDGLSGTILLISFSALGLVGWQSGNTDMMLLALTIIGALVAFLYYNSRVFRPRAATFLGDAGSMLLGFLLLAMFIGETQSSTPTLSAIGAGWIFGLPLMDTVVVMLRRIKDGKSPFSAGRDHLHHQLLNAGQSVNDTVKAMALIHLIFVLIGMLGNQYRQFEVPFFWLFVFVVVGHFFLTPRLLAKRSNAAAIKH